jgi:DNA recombination protein RmuC
VFNSHLTRLGRSLGAGVDAYNAAVGSLEHQVLPGARKFSELGILPNRKIDSLDPIDRLTREPRGRPEDEAARGTDVDMESGVDMDTSADMHAEK